MDIAVPMLSFEFYKLFDSLFPVLFPSHIMHTPIESNLIEMMDAVLYKFSPLVKTALSIRPTSQLVTVDDDFRRDIAVPMLLLVFYEQIVLNIPFLLKGTDLHTL